MHSQLKGNFLRLVIRQILTPVLVGVAVALTVLALIQGPDGVTLLGRVLWKSEGWVGTHRSSFSPAVRAAAPAVVKITDASAASLAGVQTSRFAGGVGSGASLGSGVIISDDGYILTNNHVIAHADRIGVMLRDGRETLATIAGRDPETDLAVLKIDLPNLPSLPLLESPEAEVGDVVLAIGNPFGLGQTVTMGIISATGRDGLSLNAYEEFIQTDAAINVGNSGGALVSADGELLGINTLLFTRSGGSDGIGFAIPASMARFVTESIILHGRVVRGWLGIESQPLSSTLADAYGVNRRAGILVTDTYDGGPAQLSGLRRGDILSAIDDYRTRDPQRVMNRVAQQTPGSDVTLHIIRDGRPKKVAATVMARPAVASHQVDVPYHPASMDAGKLE